ncbi:MAG: glycosyltransferase [Propionibacteriales bacterium]|nr:glycosyltransferase [Propionibacteriales bacterium]
MTSPVTDSLRVGSQSRLIRVASVPANHVYVRHLTHPTIDDQVRRLDDPVPAVQDLIPGQWWPPAMLSSAWVRANHSDFDVFHVQFGFDALGVRDLTELVEALRQLGKPLVYTVHDLRNPHHLLPGEHNAHLDVLIPAADALVTLTPGAAAEIERRWGRRPLVLPHPHVVDFDRMRWPRPTKAEFVVGVHAKSLRASMAPIPVLRVLTAELTQLRGARLQVDIHHDVFDRDGCRHDAALADHLRTASARGEIDLRVHDCFSDAELWDYLQSLDVSVLPYRFGTHSGWLEACHDLGTTVVAPSCGYLAEQRPCLTYGHDESGFDPASLRSAIRTAYETRPQWRAGVRNRLLERAEIADAQRRLYEGVL